MFVLFDCLVVIGPYKGSYLIGFFSLPFLSLFILSILIKYTLLLKELASNIILSTILNFIK